MTDKKPTDNEIKKALKEILEIMLTMGDLQKASTISKSIDLINRLQAEKQNLEIELQAMRGAANSYKAENERLKEELAISQTGYVSMEGKAWELREQLKIVKAEAYKEFAEKLKDKALRFIGNEYHTVLVDDIDNLLKELVGEDNEN